MEHDKEVAVAVERVAAVTRHVLQTLVQRERTDVRRTRHEPDVVLWPSEVEAYMGRGAWLTRDQALARVWQRSHGPSYHAALAAQTGRNQKRPRVTSNDVLTQDTTAEAGRVAGSTSSFWLYARRGVAAEASTVQAFAHSTGLRVAARHPAVSWRSDVGPFDRDWRPRPEGPIVDPGVYVFHGELDATLDDGTPVEVKTHAQSNKDDHRGMVQMQTYLFITGAVRGYIVTRPQTKDVTETAVVVVERDADAFARDVLPVIEAFVCDVRRLLRGRKEDEAMRHRVLCSHTAEPLPVTETLL